MKHIHGLSWRKVVLFALAAVGLAVSLPASTSASTRKRAVARTVKEVASYLGNTPSVCRSSYIDPRVIDLYDDGFTIADDLEAVGQDTPIGSLATHGRVEQSVLALLTQPRLALERTVRTARSKAS